MSIDIILGKNEAGDQTVTVQKWHGNKKDMAGVRTVCSLINNLITGVTKVPPFSPPLSLPPHAQSPAQRLSRPTS